MCVCVCERDPERSNDRPFPNCQSPTDMIHLPGINLSVPVSFGHCRASKSSVRTLHAAGAMLGLAPSHSLSQIGTPSLLTQLVEQKVVRRKIWSVMLINGHEGVFSVGGTSADVVARVERQTKEELDRLGELERGAALDETKEKEKEKKRKKKRDVEEEEDWTKNWKWSRVQGAAGWWQVLMQGVWVEGRKVLKNQQVIIDVCVLFFFSTLPSFFFLFYSIR